MKRIVLTIAAALVIVFAGVMPASAMTVKSIKVTNAVAYDIKSLQSTRFLATVDTPGVYAVLKVKTGTGDLVLYKGAINTTAPVQLASWDGLSGGKRLPSAVYGVTLTISKGGQTTSASTMMSVSRVWFRLSGHSSLGNVAYQKAYMLKGGANVYVGAKTSEKQHDNVWIGLSGPGLVDGKVGGVFWLSSIRPVNAVVHLTAPDAPVANGIHQFAILGANDISYTLTVIQ